MRRSLPPGTLGKESSFIVSLTCDRGGGCGGGDDKDSIDSG
jgi:hypothetical protein